MKNKVLLLLIFSYFCSFSLNGESIVLDDDTKRYSIFEFSKTLEDSGGILNIEDVFFRNDIVFSSDKVTENLGYTSSVYWLKFKITNLTDKTKWVLVIDHPMMDHVNFFFRQSFSKDYTKREGGRLYPTSIKSLSSPNTVFEFNLTKSEQAEIVLRFKTDEVMNLSSTVVPRNVFDDSNSDRKRVYGIFYGIMIGMILYNLFLSVSLRDISYLLYVLFLISLVFLFMTLNKWGIEYLWPTFVYWNRRAQPFFIGLTLLWALLFSRKLLVLPKLSSKLHVCSIFLTVVTLIEIVSALTFSYRIVIQYVTVLILADFLFIIIAASYAVYKRFSPAKYFLTAFLNLLLFSALNALSALGLVDLGVFTLYGIQISASILVLLLSFSLADRINFIRAEKEIAQKEAIENLHKADLLKDEFLANTSHELKTPLSGIINIAQNIREELKNSIDEKHLRSLGFIYQNGKRLVNLVNDILDFSKLEHKDIRLNFKPVDLRSAVSSVFFVQKNLLKTKQVTLINDVDENFQNLKVDEDRLQQILYNLINNAIKFTKNGHVKVYSRVEDHSAVVTVEDTGLGISNDRLEVIFQRFEQEDGSISREFGGTGIGLSITKSLIELHGGWIKVESEKEKGSKFIFSLPLSEVAEKTILPMSDQSLIEESQEVAFVEDQKFDEKIKILKDIKNKKRVILVVDDEASNIHTAKITLESRNYSVLIANNGFEAIEILDFVTQTLDKYGDMAMKSIDLILLDLMMPKMNGYEVARHIREKLKNTLIPIIMLTAKGQVLDEVLGLEAGANDYLRKPFEREVLLSRIEAHMNVYLLNKAVNKMKDEKVDTVTRLVAGVAHEINTPIGITKSVSSGLIDLINELRKEVDNNTITKSGLIDFIEETDERGELILANIEKAVKLVSEFKKVSANQSEEQLVEFNLSEYVDESIRSIKITLENNFEIVLEGDKQLEIKSFPANYNQLVTNLLQNSDKHAFDDSIENPSVKFEINEAANERFTFRYSDNGLGIPSEIQGKVFDPFFTTKRNRGGSGLGLSIVYNIVQKLNGTIQLNSEKGSGTEFIISLPIVHDEKLTVESKQVVEV